MLRLSGNNQVDIIETFNSTSKYFDYVQTQHWLHFFDKLWASQVYPTELKLMKANSFNTEVPLINLKLPITNGIVSSKFYYKQDHLNFGTQVTVLMWRFFISKPPKMQ